MTAGSERLCAQCGLELPRTGPCPHCLLRLALGEGEGEGEAPDSAGSPGRPPTGLHSRFFGDYELLEELARGGMGVVYRARQLSLKRIVALKMVHASHLNSPEARSRFALEVATAAQLSHPNIVALYESGEFKGTHFFTMRLVEGGDLSQHIKARRTGEPVPLCAAPPAQSAAAVVALVIKSARALHYAHERNILHRDVKPSNILIDLQGEPHLADFGLAKMLVRGGTNTYTDSVLGSPNYMAPEQASGRNDELTTAADVYGLGTVLYEALTGVPPFQAATPVETIRKVIDEDPIPPRRLKAGIDRDLETICLKCLEKKPGARYASAEDLAADLERWRDGRPILARPIGLPGTVWRWARRHPAMAGLGAALGAALVAIAVVIGAALIRIRAAEQQAVANLREALIGQADALSRSPERGARVETLRLVERAVALGGSAEFRRRARDQLLAGLALTDLTFSPQIPAPSGDGVHLTALDPAMTRWAFVREQTNLIIQRTLDGAVVRQLRLGGSPVVRVEGFSADGRFLAYREADRLLFWDTSKDGPVWATNGSPRAFCFSRTQPRVLFGEDDGTLSVRELATFREVAAVTPPPGRARRRAAWQVLSWSPNGEWFAGVRQGEGAVELIELATGRSRWRATTPGRVTNLAWALERECIVAGSSDGSIRLLRLADGVGSLLHSATRGIQQIAVSEEAALLASKSEDGVLNVFDFFDRSSRRRVFFGKFEVGGLLFDPDGTRLGPVQRGTEVGWLDLESSSEFRHASVAGAAVERVQFSADSQLLIGESGGYLALRRAADASALDRVSVSAGASTYFAIDPSSDGITTSDPRRGVRRWMMPAWSAHRRTLEAPVEAVSLPWTAGALAYSADGRRLAIAYPESSRVVVFDPTLTNVISTLSPHENLRDLALSPDGRKAATAGGSRAEIRIWDVGQHRLEVTLPAGRRMRVEFSGDGRWLIGHGDDGFAMWSTADWQPAPALPFSPDHVARSAAAFSSDARLLAVTVEGFDIQLFDLKRWEPIGLLRPPTTRHCRALAFSPDGTRLAAGCTRGVLRLWALDEIRSQMRRLNLDWEMPPLKPHAHEPRFELKRAF